MSATAASFTRVSIDGRDAAEQRCSGRLACGRSRRSPSDEKNRRGHDDRCADRQSADADRVEGVAAEQCETRAEERTEQVVEPEQLAALGRARAIGGSRDPRAVPDLPRRRSQLAVRRRVLRRRRDRMDVVAAAPADRRQRRNADGTPSPPGAW